MENQNRNVPIVGRYKVAWWTGGNQLDAKMFDSLDAARLYMMNLPQGTVSTVMKGKSASGGEYTLQLLPDGAGKMVPAASWVYKNRKAVGYTLAGIVVYRLIFK